MSASNGENVLEEAAAAAAATSVTKSCPNGTDCVQTLGQPIETPNFGQKLSRSGSKIHPLLAKIALKSCPKGKNSPNLVTLAVPFSMLLDLQFLFSAQQQQQQH